MSEDEEEEECPSLAADTLFVNRYKVIKKLGGGTFGKVYEVKDTKEHKTYALKIELAGTENSVLKVEAMIMRKFRKRHKHFTHLIDAGNYGKLNYVVMSLVGKSIDNIRKDRPTKCFSLITTLRLGQQCLQALKDLHGVGYLHRDVKPSNYALGRTPNHRRVYLIDFGLARQFMLGLNKLRPPRRPAPFRGTAIYCTIRVHEGYEQGPQDDLGSLLYAMVEMLHGKLPWQGEKDDSVLHERKRNTPSGELFKGFPDKIVAMYETLQNYDYNSIIDYKYFHSCFEKMLKKFKVNDEDPFEWE
uniref:Protein kinase domain-containing protein n=1 Tax=Trichuris muris TaxID=70415 RepID=A0A5S6QQX4_TRIMR